jgi:DNA-binding beta-propeller fold protein YncE
MPATWAAAIFLEGSEAEGAMARVSVLLAALLMLGLGCGVKQPGTKGGSSLSAADAGTPDGGKPFDPSRDGGTRPPVTVPSTIIRDENAQPGTQDWRLYRHSPGRETEAYTLASSVEAGQALDVAVSVRGEASTFEWVLYRLGYYGGSGAREMARGGPLPASQQADCPAVYPTGLIACTWSTSLRIETDASWTRGVYLVKLTRADGFQGYVTFVLHDRGSTPQILVSIPNTTWAAYDKWGGDGLYDDLLGKMPSGRAFQVTFDRPYDRGDGAGDLLRWDQGLVYWLEANALDVAYATVEDLDRDPAQIGRARLFFVSGHDEYWTGAIRRGADAAVAGGTSLILLGANAGYWQIRFEPSADGRERRIVTCYKEDAPRSDPVGPNSPELTVLFRDPPISHPESLLFGAMFNGWNEFAFPIIIRRTDHWAFEGTGFTYGDTIWRANGYELDRVFAESSPPNVEVLTESPGLTLHQGIKRGNMVVREEPNGAVVFAGGGIDFVRVFSSSEDTADARAQRLIANVLYRGLGSPVPEGLVTYDPRWPRPRPHGPFAASVSTFAGVAGETGDQDGARGVGKLLGPMGVAVAPGGGLVVADTSANKIKRVSADGTITTVAVSGLDTPVAVAVDSADNIYVADSANDCIRLISPSGAMETLAGIVDQPGYADGPGASALFNAPSGLALTRDGTALLVADLNNGVVRRIVLATREVSTVAAPKMYRPTAVAVDSSGAIYALETGTYRVVRLAADRLEPVAGGFPVGFADGPASIARFLPEFGLAVADDGTIYVADPGNYLIRRIRGGEVTTLAGTGRYGNADGPGDRADIVLPAGIALGADGTLYVAEAGNGAIRAIVP